MGDVDRALSALQHLDAGCDREQWVRIGMAAKSAGLTLDDFSCWSASAGNFAGERDVADVWRSFTDGKVTPATLFGMAFEAGWKDPAKIRHNGHSKRQTVTLAASPIRPQKTPQRAVKSVSELWARFALATDEHPYIVAKRGRADGLRVVPADNAMTIAGESVAGWLVVPALSLDGELRSMQFIPPPGTGKKLNMPRASFDDGMFVVGDMAQSTRIFIEEGIGQAWACWQATGCAAVVTFGSGRMSAVAEILRRRFPSQSLVLVADRGKEVQCSEIARAIGSAWVEMPSDKPSNFDANDYAAEYGADVLGELLERPKAPPLRFNLLSDADLAERPMLQQRIKDVFPLIGTAAVFGASGSGKSFLIVDAAQSVDRWFGYRVKSCRWIYCALEGEGGIAGRVKAYRIRHGASSDRIRYLLQPFSLLADADVIDLARAIEAAGGAGVVVLDTLHASAPGADENSAADMGTIIAAAKKLQTLIGGLVILVHHVGKDSSRGLRGHSSLLAALDAAIEVRRDGDNREWCIVKCKDGMDGAAHPFRLDTVELGTDADGDAITSCVIRPVEAAAKEMRRIPPPKAGNQAIIWSALGDLFRKAGDARPEVAPATLPHGRPCLKLEDAIEQTRTRLVCDPKRQTERTQTAIIGLINRGLLITADGLLWCAT